MQKKEKKVVDYAESTSTRIILYSNNPNENRHLVAEQNKEGEIKIFFEKNNKNYNNENYDFENQKIEGIIYLLLYTYIYIIWATINYKIFNNSLNFKSELGIIVFFNIGFILFFYSMFLHNKYKDLFTLLLIIYIVSYNLFQNFILISYYQVKIRIKIFLIIAFLLLMWIIVFEYIYSYIFYGRKSRELRGKHSVEHMMCNYIEKYNTYPSTVKKLKKASRFSLDCGGLYGDKKFEESIALSISSIIAVYGSIYILDIIVYIAKVTASNRYRIIVTTYVVLIFFLILYVEIYVLKSLIYSILIIFSQCITTLSKKKIKYRDLRMGNLLSKEFIRWQYPHDKN